ncbi:SDR family NAD(P)-dependent oxidoreductase [uncultured Bacteroides sp.]|uniref:SDR family NAD(P)-dependent oxidoreductase n=1 Tax=uncultured Bacteroides sp. TaxID=162156 RepID=UPI002AAAAA7F|nr:SDR family NAD(P)-dependent oxidoreductase [uncultured Bacteroides sp.]
MKQQFSFDNELSGKVALVTGGTKEAEKAISERLLKAETTVAITARNKPEGSKKVVDEILKKFGRLDILVNNLGASETQGGGFAVLTDEDWETTIKTNLLAPVRLDRGFYRK